MSTFSRKSNNSPQHHSSFENYTLVVLGEDQDVPQGPILLKSSPYLLQFRPLRASSTLKTQGKIIGYGLYLCIFPSSASSDSILLKSFTINAMRGLHVTLQGLKLILHSPQTGLEVCTLDRLSKAIIETVQLSNEDLEIKSLLLNSKGTFLACATFNEWIYVFDLNTRQRITLRGHLGSVTHLAFLDTLSGGSDSQQEPKRNWIMSSSEDRTFKIWDLDQRTCLYQSSILSAFPLISFDVDPLRPRICLASEDGLLHFYSLFGPQSKELAPRLLKKLDVFSIWDRYKLEKSQDLNRNKTEDVVISSIPQWRDRMMATAAEPDESSSVSHQVESTHILNVSYLDLNIESSQSLIIAGLSTGIILLGSHTYETLFIFDFQSTSIPKHIDDCEERHVKVALPLLHSIGFKIVNIVNPTILVSAFNRLSKQAFLMRLSPKSDWTLPEAELEFSKKSNISPDLPLDEFLSESIKSRIKGGWADKVYKDCLGLLASVDIRCMADLKEVDQIPDTIPHYVQHDLETVIKYHQSQVLDERDLSLSFTQPLLLRVPDEEDDRAFLIRFNKTPSKAKKHASSPLDKPVTFRNKVKSSGYTAPPLVTKLFTSPSSQRKSRSKAKNQVGPSKKHTYPMNASPTVQPHQKDFSIKHTAGVLCLAYHSSGRLLATGSADQTSRSYKLSNGHAKDFIGHDGMIQDLSWSFGSHSAYGPLLLTASTDGHVRMWSMDKSEALLDFHHIQRSSNSANLLQSKKAYPAPSKKTPSKASMTGTCFAGEIKSTHFYYHDKFVALSNGPKIYLYSFDLEKPDLQSIRPGSNHNSYKLVNTVVSESQAITSFTCANSYKSHLLLGASSNKSCLIWDLNINRLMRTLPEAHSRWIHDISIADYEFVPSSFENIFVTTAVTDGIKAWDLRTQKPVMHFSGHVNRACAIRTCLSPCGRFIATGSEDHHAYVYDFRQGTILSKTLGHHLDTVVSVAYSPVIPELATGSLDGQVRFFRSV